VRVIHLKEVLFNPTRFFLAVWDGASGQFVPNAEWIVHAVEDNRMMAARLQTAVKYFTSQQCVGVMDEVAKILAQYGVALPAGWKSYEARK
jgi:hypothetical protein